MKNHAISPEQSYRLGRLPAANRFRKLGLPMVGALMLGAFVLAPPGAQAQAPFIPNIPPTPFLGSVSPFTHGGFIQAATLDTTCTSHPLCGGTLTQNGIKIVVPKGTILQFPANTMSWEDVFNVAPAPYKALGQTGLAMSDTPKPFTTYFATILGNRVINGASDQYIAGLIYISQDPGNASQGFINFIDYTKGEMWVGQQLGTGPSGTRLHINTPQGRYGKPDPKADQRFSADEDNPTISAETGYPMCLPRTDPKIANDPVCPSWNRPVDPFTKAYSTIFTMSPATPGAAVAGITHQTGFPNPPVKPDPFEQVPFEIGDYITYQGSLIQDAQCIAGQPLSSCQYISAHTITANLGIFTAPGTWPVYVQIGGPFRIQVGGAPNPVFPIEAAEKFFLVSTTTDSTQLIDIYAVDVNPCTGAISHRFYGAGDPFGPPLGGVKGRAQLHTTIGNFMPATRTVAVASRALTKGAPLDNLFPTLRLTANGVTAGHFSAPQFEFIFDENLLFGSTQPPLTFEALPFLVNGSGPYTPALGGAAVPGFGPGGTAQLTPYPNLSAPTPTCTTGQSLIQPPTSQAGPPQSVPSGATVTLSAAGSIDTNVPPMQLIYTWVQIAGPTVNLSNPGSVQTTFVAPTLAAGAAPVVLTFQLAVCNGFTCGGIASVPVTVNPSATAPKVTLTATPSLNVVAGARVTITGTATGTGVLAHTFAQTAGPAQVLTRTATAIAFTATLPAGTALPATLTFTDTVTSGAGTTVAKISVFVGADTITVSVVNYALSKSTIAVTANTNALPKGSAVLTVTVLGSNGLPLIGDFVLPYDPTTDTYTIGLEAVVVNPIPAAIRIRSSYGGVLVSPILTIQ